MNAKPIPLEVRRVVQALLIRADSICSLVAAREGHALSEESRRELWAVSYACREAAKEL